MLHCILYLFSAFCIATGWVDYKDVQDNYMVSYPENWHVTKEQGITMFLMTEEKVAGEFSEHITIMPQDLSNYPMTLDEYTKLSLDQYNAPPKADKIGPVLDVKLDGYEAKNVTITISYQGFNLKVKQYWFLKDNSAYLLTYTARESKFDEYVADASKLIESFSFIK